MKSKHEIIYKFNMLTYQEWKVQNNLVEVSQPVQRERLTQLIQATVDAIVQDVNTYVTAQGVNPVAESFRKSIHQSLSDKFYSLNFNEISKFPFATKIIRAEIGEVINETFIKRLLIDNGYKRINLLLEMTENDLVNNLREKLEGLADEASALLNEVDGEEEPTLSKKDFRIAMGDFIRNNSARIYWTIIDEVDSGTSEGISTSGKAVALALGKLYSSSASDENKIEYGKEIIRQLRISFEMKHTPPASIRKVDMTVWRSFIDHVRSRMPTGRVHLPATASTSAGITAGTSSATPTNISAGTSSAAMPTAFGARASTAAGGVPKRLKYGKSDADYDIDPDNVDDIDPLVRGSGIHPDEVDVINPPRPQGASLRSTTKIGAAKSIVNPPRPQGVSLRSTTKIGAAKSQEPDLQEPSSLQGNKLYPTGARGSRERITITHDQITHMKNRLKGLFARFEKKGSRAPKGPNWVSEYHREVDSLLGADGEFAMAFAKQIAKLSERAKIWVKSRLMELGLDKVRLQVTPIKDFYKSVDDIENDPAFSFTERV